MAFTTKTCVDSQVAQLPSSCPMFPMATLHTDTSLCNCHQLSCEAMGYPGIQAATTGIQGTYLLAGGTWRIRVAGNPHLCHQAVSAPMLATSALLTGTVSHPTAGGRASVFGKNPSPSRIYQC